LDKKILYFIDEILMIYSLETSLAYDVNKKKNFTKFYNERTLVNPKHILERIILAYIKFNFIHPSPEL